MNQIDQTVAGLEGRVLAHRRVLAQILARLPEADWCHLSTGLAASELFQDGQEDPGAVVTEGLEQELSIADEYTRLATLAQGLRDAR